MRSFILSDQGMLRIVTVLKNHGLLLIHGNQEHHHIQLNKENSHLISRDGGGGGG